MGTKSPSFLKKYCINLLFDLGYYGVLKHDSFRRPLEPRLSLDKIVSFGVLGVHHRSTSEALSTPGGTESRQAGQKAFVSNCSTQEDRMDRMDGTVPR